jgi:hypothetical protein
MTLCARLIVVSALTQARLRLLGATFALVGALTTSTSGAEGFVYAGLSLRTTVEEARKHFPKSSLVGRHVYVADEESHDDIHGIDLPGDDGNRRLRIFFERRGSRRNEYPRCEHNVARISAQYGEPARIQEFDEERSRNRRVSWFQRDEVLAVLCFRVGPQAHSAVELTITPRGQD